MEKQKFEVKPQEKNSPAENETEIDPVRSRAHVEGEPRPEGREEALAEVSETVIEEKQVKSAWQELITQAKEEFPERIKQIIDKASRGEKLTGKEVSDFDSFSSRWFRGTFGIKKKTLQKESKRPLTEEEELARRKQQSEEDKKKNREKKKQPQLQKLAEQKNTKMKQLHNALRNLDAGESVEEFIDETRRVVYFDEQNQQYFIEENGKRKKVGIGDISSDYAWGIKYFPDSRMLDPTAYRTLVKRILTNETRRDLEKIHDTELKTQKPSLANIEPHVIKVLEFEKISEEMLKPLIGGIAEIEVREFLNRIASNYGLDFIVMRADVQEDSEYKYDFKIRFKQRNRGVKVEGSELKLPTKIGFQLKTHLEKVTGVTSRKYTKGKIKTVEEVLLISVSTDEFLESIKKWLDQGRPSGGPEQFLSPELKKAILKAVTEKLVDIPQEVFDKIE